MLLWMRLCLETGVTAVWLGDGTMQEGQGTQETVQHHVGRSQMSGSW